MDTTDNRQQLKANYLIDPHSKLVEKCYAVVTKPRRTRNRFPENCVFVKNSLAEAVDDADPSKNLYPALLYGPCRSSEGLKLYYLVEWIEP